MTTKTLFKTAFLSLKTNKSRASLTILGIVIGVAAIMIIMSVGQGGKSLILTQIESIGSDVVVIRPGREPRGPVDVAETIMSDSLKEKELRAIRRQENVPELAEAVPAVLVPGSVSYQGETFRKAVVFGWSAEWLGKLFNIYPIQGKFFSDSEIKTYGSVAVIGWRVKEELFGSSEAVGKKIKIRGKKFRIVGVLPPRGQVSMFNIDEIVILPYSTAQKYLLGISHYHEIVAKAKNEKLVPQMVENIKRTLRELHGIKDPEKDDFYIMTQHDMIDRINIVTQILTILLSSVAAISLLVGGIGIMNIMLVSVTERTREIGLRKALGATNRDIMIQFLFEAVILTFVGGLLGVVLGGGISYLVSFILGKITSSNWPFVFPISAACLGLGFSALIGLIFGLYPARQASLKDPIEALRYE